MILVVTHSQDLTADLVIRHFHERQTPFLRLDTDQLGTPQCHFASDGQPLLILKDRQYRQKDFGAVWARRFARPVVSADLDLRYRDFVSRENGVVMDAFLETIDCFQMNPYMVDRLSGNRLIQTARAEAAGLRVPASCTTQEQHSVERFLAQFPDAVTKALSFGRLIPGDTEGATIAFTSPVTLQTDWSGLSVAPTLLQERIPAKYEWRITTVGDAVFSARTASSGDVDWRKNDRAVFEQADLPWAIQDRILQLCRVSSLAYGAHDLIETPAGEFVFLETNPAGQWGWLEVQCDLPIGEAVADALVKHHA